jgi:hypothetical protein
MKRHWAEGLPTTTQIVVMPPAGRLAEIAATKDRLSSYLTARFPGFQFEICDKPLDDDFNAFPLCCSASNGTVDSFTLLGPPAASTMDEIRAALRSFDPTRSALN